LLVAVVVQHVTPAIFDSYEKEDGINNS